MENDEYQEKAGNIRQLAAMPPPQLSDHLASLHPNIPSVAPNIAPHVYSAAANAIAFLNSKLPSAGNELLQDKMPEPSKAQKASWLDLHQTVNDPLSVLNHVKRGTLNGNHLEALQSVYPDVHQEMIQKTFEQLGEMKKTAAQLPYAKRVAISKFIGQPLDSTLMPDSYQAILSSASQNTGPMAQEAQKGNKGTSRATLDQMSKVTQQEQTPAQNREIQKGKRK